jgi:outer membrane protein assembly complex protein YaeT
MRSISSCISPSARRAFGRAALIAGTLAVIGSTASATSPDPYLQQRRLERLASLGPVIDAVRFEGNNAFTAKELLRYMYTKPGWFMAPRHYTSRVLTLDLSNLERFYATQGYLDAELGLADSRVSADGSRVELLISVHEGDRWHVSEVSFEGNHVLTTGKLLELTKLRESDPLLSQVLESDRSAILAEYARRSYLDATVLQNIDRDEDATEAAVHYVIVERRQSLIDSIVLTGLTKTRKYVVTREFEFAPGETFSFEKIGETQAALYKTGLFNSVWIEPAPQDTGKVERTLLVRLSERKSVVADLSAGYAVIDGAEAGLEFANRNIQGQALRAGATGRVSEFAREAGVSIADPWFLGVHVGIDARANYAWEDERAYVAETVGSSFLLSRLVGKAVTIEGGYSFSRTAILRAVEGAGGGDNYTSDLIAAVTRDTRDDILNATRGSLSRAEVNFASPNLGGTNNFVRAELIWRRFQKVSRRNVAALAVHMGWVRSQGEGASVPVNERYFAGGDGSVRGFGRNSLGPTGADGEPTGGRAILEIRAEWRHPVLGHLGGVVFADAGQAFVDLASVRPAELAVGAGLGLRYDTRIGVLRFDVAAPVSETGRTRYYLGVGQAF